jgi:hypothetical protein
VTYSYRQMTQCKGKQRQSQRSRIKPRRGWLWLYVVCWSLGSLLFFHARSGVADADAPMQTYRVQPGDTVWSIVIKERPHSDVRYMVKRVLQVNHLSGPDTVYPGQVLSIPQD